MCTGTDLAINMPLASQTGRFRLILQTNGDIQITQNGVADPVWDANVQNGDRLTFQGDGNLVLYSGVNTVWDSKTSGKTNVFLVMQNDGNLVLYDKKTLVPYWNSKTKQDGQPANIPLDELKNICPVNNDNQMSFKNQAEFRVVSKVLVSNNNLRGPVAKVY